MNVNDARAVANDQELVEGIFKLGARYYVRTPTYHYLGTLVAVTPYVYVLRDHGTVFESGPFKDLFGGKPKDYQPHEGSAEILIDRAGTTLDRFAK